MIKQSWLICIFDNFDVDGKEYPLSFSLFEDNWEYENNTKIRRAAFDAFSSKLKEYQNTICSNISNSGAKRKNINIT